jgi:hypothetical protein
MDIDIKGMPRPPLRTGTIEPSGIEWWAEGKPATRAQVAASVESGLPSLAALAEQQEGASEDLLARTRWLESRYPI